MSRALEIVGAVAFGLGSPLGITAIGILTAVAWRMGAF